MPLYGHILRANFFYLKNSINRQINGDLKPLKAFGINFFGSYHPLILETDSSRGRPLETPKNLFKFLAGVSTTIATIAIATAFRVLY